MARVQRENAELTRELAAKDGIIRLLEEELDEMAEVVHGGGAYLQEKAEVVDDARGAAQFQASASGAAAKGPVQVGGGIDSTPVSSPSGAEVPLRSTEKGGASTGGKQRMSYAAVAMRGSGGGAVGRLRQRSPECSPLGVAGSPLGAAEADEGLVVSGAACTHPSAVATSSRVTPHSAVMSGASPSPAVRTALSPFAPPAAAAAASARRSTAPAASNQLLLPSMAQSTSEAVAAAAAALRSIGGAVAPGSPKAIGPQYTSLRGVSVGGDPTQQPPAATLRAVDVPTWQEPESLVKV